MTKRNFLIKILVGLFAICLALTFATATFSVKATSETEDEIPTVATVQMHEGAQVRLKSAEGALKDVSGIRFRFYVNKTYYSSLVATVEEQTVNPEVGIYVAIATEETTDAYMQAEETAELSKFKFIASENGLIDMGDVYAFNAVVAGIPVENYNTSLIANGYVKKAGENKVFAANPQTRSVAEVASVSLSKGFEDPFGDLEDYVDGVVTTDNFKFEKTEISTDMYTAAPSVNATLPEKLTAIWESSNTDVATVDANGNVTRVGMGETTISATLGSNVKQATLTIGAPIVLNPSESTVSSIIGGTGEYLASTEFSGDYTGAAIKRTLAGVTTYKVKSTYTAEQLAAISEDYSHVNMWFAYHFEDSNGTTASYYDIYNANLVYTKAGGSGINLANASFTNDTWKKYTVSIEDYISLLDSENNVALIKGDVVGITSAASYLCFGAIEFVERTIPTILTVTADTYDKVTRGAIKPTYVAAGADEIKDFTGDYTGNAAAILHVAGSQSYYINSISETLFATYKDEYTHVSLWMAYDYIEGATGTLYATGTSLCSKAGVGWGTLSASGIKQWKKYTITVDDFASLIDSSDRVMLLKICCDAGAALGSKATIYFGDIVFETIAE